MSTSTIDYNALATDLQRFAPLFQAYLECSDELQIHAQKLFKILSDPATDVDDRELAAMTLADVLFPNFHEGELGSDLEECETMAANARSSASVLGSLRILNSFCAWTCSSSPHSKYAWKSGAKR